jgi:virulence-associated protein VapD
MLVDVSDAALTEGERIDLGPPPLSGGRFMYAITFDLDTKELAKAYPGGSPNYAWTAIGNFLKGRGFDWQQGSVYFGNESMDPVKAVLAIQDLTRTYPWFNSRVVRDIRMLRIEENNDLNPVIRYVEDIEPPPTFDFFGVAPEA